MAAENNINTFTAADIEKYHRGLLSSKEMHALEKAALDDPFLADALEGYATPGIKITADLAELKSRLTERTEDVARVVSIQKERRTFAPILRIAAMVVVVAGAGLLVYQFAFTGKNKQEVAQNKTTESTATKPAETVQTDTGAYKNTTADNKSGTVTTTSTDVTTQPAKQADNVPSNDGRAGIKKEDVTVTVPKPVNNTDRNEQPAGAIADTKSVPSGGAPAPVSTNKEGEVKDLAQNKPENNVQREVSKAKAPAIARKQQPSPVSTETTRGLGDDEDDLSKEKKAVAAGTQPAERYYSRDQAMNTFRGRVTDQQNTGLPFANVTNTKDNVGTYTDANGNFVLTSGDSLMNVQVRSLGYDNSNIQLRRDVASNKVIMQEDRGTSQIVLNNSKPNTALRSRLDSSRKLTEPVPADGWSNYDSYLANNLNIPDDFRDTRSNNNSSVQVSFEVDKNGEPVNIRVEKSLCSACDKEAVRLIKEGPKWKRNAGKKGRTTVTINF